MEGINCHFTVRISFNFLLLLLLQTSTEAQDLCSVPTPVRFPENNLIGDTVVTIAAQPGVTVAFQPPPANPDNPFRLEGYQLIAARIFDYENVRSFTARVTCTATSGLSSPLSIIVRLTNLNDNRPVFEQSLYNVNVDEMSSVNTIVGRFPASDGDGEPLFYSLTSESDGFILSSPTNPEILVQTPLEYERVKQVKLMLYAQDTPLAPPSSDVSFTASTTVMVTIVDVDNRPPWFLPCTKYEIGGTVMCQSYGYTGSVFLNETEPGELALEPGPVFAIDGDSGINTPMTYSFLSGNDDGLFLINPAMGNITLLKPATVLKTITLTVLAAQTINSNQFATTTVTISVQRKSLHPPRFQKNLYEGVVTGVGIKATDAKNKDELLLIVATDEDYASTGGLNPHITYRIEGSSDFSIVNNYLFMTKEVPEAILALRVLAIDLSNEQSAITQLSVQVTSDPTTTVPLSTTDSTVKTTTGESTTEDTGSITTPSMSTDSSVSTPITSMTSESITTTNTVTPTESSVSTITPSVTSEGSTSSAGTTHPHTGPTTTREPVSTTDGTAPTIPGESTTNSKTTEDTGSTTKPSMSPESSVSTTLPSMTSESITTTTNSVTTPESGVSTITPSLTTTTNSVTTPESGVSTITPSLTTTTNSVTTPESGVSTITPSLTSESITTTSNSVTSTESGVSTTTPSLTSEGSISTASTVHPHTVIVSSGGYGTADMAALGATLGVLLFICVAVIGVLLFYMRRGTADWQKIYETSMFRSSLAQGSAGQKDVIQYTNDAFQNDEDGNSLGSGGPERVSGIVGKEPLKAGGDILLYESIAKSSEPLHDLLGDDTSQAGSDQSDSEKRVKPILTRERRVDEGYKSVWFKEDIDPDAKEEVVIIPDSREIDSEEEDEEEPSSSREDDEYKLEIKSPRVIFNDADLDSGLGVKMDDPAEDSDNEEVLNTDL